MHDIPVPIYERSSRSKGRCLDCDIGFDGAQNGPCKDDEFKLLRLAELVRVKNRCYQRIFLFSAREVSCSSVQEKMGHALVLPKTFTRMIRQRLATGFEELEVRDN